MSPAPTVAELSAPYTNFLNNPLSPGADGVCSVCLTFTEGYRTCYRCGRGPRFADAVLPISYSVVFGQLHTALAQYKRRQGPTAQALQLQLAAVLWRFLRDHEPCLARRANVERFQLVATVPSGDQARDAVHPLRRIVGARRPHPGSLPAAAGALGRPRGGACAGSRQVQPDAGPRR